MIALLLSAFVTLFVVIDPPGCAPIFAGLTRDASPVQRRSMAIRSTLIATVLLFLFALVGEKLLATLGISLDAFRIAGGIMLFLIALEMVFEKRTERREGRADEISRKAAEEHRPVEDISVFPMAIPMIAGPGSIATVMLLVSRSHGIEQTLLVLLALAAVLALTMAALLAAGPIMRVLGPKLEAMITRVLGVLLAALAAQFVIDGISAAFGVR
ncbi:MULTISPECIES: MarC family protein [unclassified Sphingomonas]|uniref:MarC family protein n=1 Tax=unclassified Sphingomonas TaxID=196159 RepID=UPI0006FC0AFF|nr:MULTISPECIES: MarC family protein [unclassified Sphingomonas]KQX25423.1 MarC family transcriptional regulator [Sphingomonas sp. Root1294]KQY66415.1 MarC family transcriptional regulator [Sphingomonas sp. Root50]KRB90268.1 MarC family transcriptional regulator [Sphingomonas sp. Root720]